MLLAAFFWASQALAEEIYIRYDKSCMHRLEYAYGFTPPNMEYIKYQLMLGENEAVILEIGPENASSPQSYFNNPTVACGDAAINKELVNKIRNNTAQVFMVRQVGTRYYVSKANNASYFRRDNNGVIYDSWQYQVNSNGGLKIGDNITKKDNAQGIDITYQGPTKYQCADAYKFEMRFSHASTGSYREMFFVPGIGIVEERPTGDPQNIYKLKTFNDTPLDQVLQEYCQKNMAPLSSNFLPGASSSASSSSYSPVPAASGAVVYHEVERGETLYSISRKYNVGVSDLQDWNGLTSNTLYVGKRLQVSPPPGTSNDLAARGGMEPPVSYSAGSSTAVPNSWGASTATNLPAWKTTSGYHQVQPGETVASVALEYGYTEARFRDMNNLGPNDFLKIGQTLKTTDCPPSSPAGDLTPRGIQQPDNLMSSNVYPPTTIVPSTDPLTGTAATLPTGTNTSSLPTGNTTAAQSSYTPPPVSTPPSATFDPYGSNVPDFHNLPPVDQETNVPSTGTATLPGGVTLPSGGGAGPYPNSDYFPPASSQPSNELQPRGPTLPTNSAAQPAATSPPSNNSVFGTPIPTTGAQPGSVPVPVTADPFSSTDPAPGYNNNSAQVYPSSYNYQNSGGSTNQPASYKRTYVVQDGDTIDSIAKRFGTTPDRLRAINNLDRHEILIPYKRIYID